MSSLAVYNVFFLLFYFRATQKDIGLSGESSVAPCEQHSSWFTRTVLTFPPSVFLKYVPIVVVFCIWFSLLVMHIINRSPRAEEAERPETYTCPQHLDKLFPWYFQIQDICLTLSAIFKETKSQCSVKRKIKTKCEIWNNKKKKTKPKTKTKPLEKCWKIVETPSLVLIFEKGVQLPSRLFCSFGSTNKSVYTAWSLFVTLHHII